MTAALLSLVLRVRGPGRVLARFNDVPLVWADAHWPQAGSTLHEYMVAGPNQLTLEWTASPLRPDSRSGSHTDNGPHRRQDAPDVPLASARVLWAHPGAAMTPGTSRTLMGCELQAPTTTERPWPWLARSTPQPAATVLCDLPAAFPRWRWQDAPRLRPRAHHIAQAHAALRALATALQHGNAAVLADLLALRHRELAMAYPGHPPLLPPIDGLKWQWPGLDDFRLLPQAGGRLHEAVDRQGRPALAAFDRQGQRQRDWPLRLAYLDRRWTVVR